MLASILEQTRTTTTEISTGLGVGILIAYAIGGLISLALFILAIMNVIDFTKHSDQAWEASGTPKQTALIIIILQFVCCGLLALYYKFSIQPKVTAAEGGGYTG
jgi:hypothetical protein